ncbi:MAG TPA: zinc metalloprotease HtpX, partial [Magnetococcales bacterium]|nr:zinc metalloprotease HtpX [Magnetococcales bacterium]
VLLAGMTALFLVVGQALGGHNGMMLALFMAVALNFWAYWNSDKMVLRMHNAYEIGPQEAPEYFAIVEELARRARLPMPRVYIMDDSSPNAFATGRDPEHAAVAATTGLLRILNREELAGVMAHELAHVQNRDILISTITATFAGAITTLANMAQWASLFGMGRSNSEEEGGGGGSGLGGILMMLLAPIAAMLIQMAVSRSREYGADQRGAEICGNPLWLASALDKLDAGSRRLPMWSAQTNPASSHLFIVSPLSGSALAGLFSTHPPMEERIHRLQQMARPS